MADDSERPDPATFLREHVAPRSRRRIDELRGEIARLERRLADVLAAEATVEVVVEGEGGGSWYLNLREGETRVEERPAAPPVVRLHQTRADWDAFTATGGLGGGGAAVGAELTRTRVERLRTLDGAIEFRLTTDAGAHRTVLQLGTGAGGEPKCTVSMSAADALRLGSGDVSPQAAFLQGLVKVQGDIAFAMQVGAALLL